jgi:hypothetical protein
LALTAIMGRSALVHGLPAKPDASGGAVAWNGSFPIRQPRRRTRQTAVVLIEAVIQNELKSPGLSDQQITAEIEKHRRLVLAPTTPTGIN